MAHEFELRKIKSLKALQSKPNPNVCRTPTNVWAGYGCSQTTPVIPTVNESQSVNINFNYS